MIQHLKWPLLGLMLLVSTPVHATGFGWYAVDLDYQVYLELTREQPALREDWSATRGALDDHAERLRVRTADFGEAELLWVEALHAAYRVQVAQNPQTFFRFFEHGKRLPDRESPVCGPGGQPGYGFYRGDRFGYCESIVFLSPAEVEGFFWEVTALIAQARQWEDPEVESYLVLIKDTLKTALMNDRAVVFYAHD